MQDVRRIHVNQQQQGFINKAIKKTTQTGMIISGTYFAVNKALDFYLMATSTSYLKEPYGSHSDCTRLCALGIFTVCYFMNKNIAE